MWKGHTRSLQAHPCLPRFTFDICKKSNRHESSGGIGAKQGASSPCSSKMKSGTDPCLGYAPCLEKLCLCVNKCGEPPGWIVAPSCPPCGSTGPSNQAGGSGVK